jgi:hypothetical protein
MWVVTDSPSDFPGLYAARKHLIVAGASITTDEVVADVSLEALRRRLIDLGCDAMIPRHPSDDPVIMECWL